MKAGAQVLPPSSEYDSSWEARHVSCNRPVLGVWSNHTFSHVVRKPPRRSSPLLLQIL